VSFAVLDGVRRGEFSGRLLTEPPSLVYNEDAPVVTVARSGLICTSHLTVAAGLCLSPNAVCRTSRRIVTGCDLALANGVALLTKKLTSVRWQARRDHSDGLRGTTWRDSHSCP